MTNRNDVLAVVREIVRGTMKGDGLQDDEDMFDAGATSLTIVNIQLRLEERLQLKVPTHRLMSSPSIQGFAALYSSVASNT